MRFSDGDRDIAFDNITLEDDSGILIYNEIITAGGYLSFEAGHQILLEEFTGLSENKFIHA